MLRQITSAFVIIVIAFACEPRQQAVFLGIDPEIERDKNSTYMFVIGDWGRNGRYGQSELGHTMGEVADKVKPEFVISTGDNFYPDGVGSTTDAAWTSSFEDIYTAEGLSCPWYVTLGNHDYQGDVQAQIDYTEVSDRWEMPSRYFHKDIETASGATIRILFVDTSPYNNAYYSNFRYRNAILGQDTAAQTVWMRGKLEAEFDWKVVVGHHPLYTGGSRATDRNYVRDNLEPILDEYEVDLYLAGHEHDLQHLKPSGHPTHHFVSGAGSKLRATGSINATLFAASIQGFLIIEAFEQSLKMEFVNVEGAIIYSYEMTKKNT